MQSWAVAALLLIPHIAWAAPPESGRVSVDLERYERLRADVEALRTPRPPPQAFVFVRRSIDVRFDQGVVRGTMSVEVEVLAEQPVAIPLLERSASLESIRIDGEPTVALRDEPQANAQSLGAGFLAVRSRGAGRHVIEVRFALGRQQARFGRHIDFALPRAPITALRLNLPEPDLVVQVDGGIVRRQQNKGGRTVVEAQLGSLPGFSVRWRPRVREGSAEGLEVETEVLARLRLADGLSDLSTSLVYQVVTGETDRVRFRVPAGLEVIKVHGPAVLQWFAEPAGPNRGVTVLLRYLVDEKVVIHVDARAPRSDDHVRPGWIAPLGAAFAGGHLVVEARSGYALTVDKAEGAQRVSLRSVPESLRNAVDRPYRFAFELTRPDPDLRFGVRRNQELKLTQAVIDELQVSSVQVEQGIEITKLSLHIRNNTRQYLRATLPADAELTHALVDGTPMTPAQDEDGSVLIPLIQSERIGEGRRYHRIRAGDTLTALGKRYFNNIEAWRDIVNANPSIMTAYDLKVGSQIIIPRQARGLTFEESAFIVELAYKRKRAPLGTAGRRRIELPTFDVAIMSVYWHHYFPSVYEPLSVESNLQPLTRIRYGLLTRIRHLLADAGLVSRAWAGGSGLYRNILQSRKAIYRKEQKRRVTEARSAFPLVGTRYRFKRVLPAEEAAFVQFLYVDRGYLAPIPKVAFWLMTLLAFIWAAGAKGRSVSRWILGPSTLSLAVAGGVLLVVGHYALGTYASALNGLNTGLIAALIVRWAKTRSASSWSWRLLFAAATWKRLALIALAAIVASALPSAIAAAVLVAALIAFILVRESSAALAVVAVLGASLPAVASPPARADLDVKTWDRLQKERQALRLARQSEEQAPKAVVGQTDYRGRAAGDVLEMKLNLTVDLPTPATFRQVPIVGVDAVIVRASVDGRPVELTPVGQYWAWMTKRTGTFSVEIEFLAGPRGPRGSLEYQFGVVESPVTTLRISFDRTGLSPRVDRAVTQAVTEKGGRTELAAVLAPTTKVNVLGLYDVGQESADPAKLYAETHSLVSLTDEAVEMFSVIRYTILYATEKRFAVRLPAGWEVVTADGQGAFSYRIVTEDHRPVLRGETALGIEDRYEVSIRLRRPRAPNEHEVTLFSPEVLGVERDAGFVALEVPGKLSVERMSGEGYTAIDVRSLPPAILQSSVSPIVRAFRYGGARGAAQIVVADHPEREIAPGGIDVIRAASVVSTDGRVMTDVTFLLRNNLRQALRLKLPKGATVQSAHLENEPVQPSKGLDGWLIMPLKRSMRRGESLQAFSVQLVYRHDTSPLDSFGRKKLLLPTLEVPVSSLEWSLYAPTGYDVSGFVQGVRPQRYQREARFASPPPDPYDPLRVSAGAGPAVEAGSGALPVRVRLPRSGRPKVSTRYWIGAEETLEAEFHYIQRSWGSMRIGFGILLGIGLLGVAAAIMYRLARGRH